MATLRFFCIISWSSPVMAMVMNIPARICFRKKPSLRQSVSRMRDMPLSESWPPQPLMSAWPTMYTMVPMSAPSMKSVCSVSVHTMVFTPPFKV